MSFGAQSRARVGRRTARESRGRLGARDVLGDV
jgi:hypothetical protein